MKLSELNFGKVEKDGEFNWLGLTAEDYQGKKVLTFLNDEKYYKEIENNKSITCIITTDEVAKKIDLASKFAKTDIYRAATHNKGIFNGIDAILIATGNDWRAIEAGAHAFASRDGRYQGLSQWTLDMEREELVGEMTLPMPVATKGGSIGLNPRVALSHELLGNPSAKELAQIIVSIGLAQNFAALKALVSTGIQQGHMKLQAKSLALLAGASESEVAPLVERLIADKTFNLETAQRYLENLRS